MVCPWAEKGILTSLLGRLCDTLTRLHRHPESLVRIFGHSSTQARGDSITSWITFHVDYTTVRHARLVIVIVSSWPTCKFGDLGDSTLQVCRTW